MALDEQVNSGGTGGLRMEAASRGRRFIWLAAVIIAADVMVLLWRMAPALVSADGNGYWVAGRLLAETGHTWLRPEVPVQYVGYHWLLTDDGRMVSRYPPGLPLAIAAIYRLFGWQCGLYLPVLAAATMLWGCFLLFRRLFPSGWAVFGLGILVLNPVVFWHGLLAYSHLPVMCLLVWGFYLLVAWRQDRRWWQALLAGLLLGMIPSVRYAEALVALPVGIYLLLGYRQPWRQTVGHWLLAGLGALLPVLPLLLRNQTLYGACWRTGYSMTAESSAFGGDNALLVGLQFLQALLCHGLGIMLPLGLVCLILMSIDRRSRNEGVLLLSTVLVVTGLYLSYYGINNKESAFTVRFALPTFFAYAAGYVWMVNWINERKPMLARWLAILLLAMQALWPGYELWTKPGGPSQFMKAFAEATKALEDQVPKGAVIIAHPQFLQHLDYVGRWKLVDMTLLNPDLLRPRPRASGPGAFQEDILARRLAKYQGLQPEAYGLAVARDIRKWAGDAPVYWVGGAWELAAEFDRPAPFSHGEMEPALRQPLTFGKAVSEVMMAAVSRNPRRPRPTVEELNRAGPQLCLGDELAVALWTWSEKKTAISQFGPH